MPETTYLTCAETAKLVRATLKSKWPGVKFSVRSETYSMGASIRVAWIDGPTTKEVDHAVNPYVGADFNGMEDIKEYRDALLLPGPDGELRLTRPGADYIFTEREYSPAFWWEAAKLEAAEWGAEGLTPTVRSSYWFKGKLVAGGFEGSYRELEVDPNHRMDLNALVRRALENPNEEAA